MILIIQFRSDQSAWHEIKCFYESIDIPHTEYIIINAMNQKLKEKDILCFANLSKAVIMGGMGESGYEEKNKEKKQTFLKMEKKMKNILKKLIQKKKPILGICMGHQLLLSALGGKVELDENQAETGFIKIFKTEKGIRSPLFNGLTKKFNAISGHKSSAIEIPKECNILAYSNKCQTHSFQYKNLPIFGVQFHPEMNAKEVIFRLSLYREYLTFKTNINQKTKIKTKIIFKNFLKIAKVK